ncbi:MAG: hypothetical protein NTW97_04440 [Candidatus Krumholzibacteria bacterium]|nr:hypothetical protein [Candidatus Krumholzibacteria bacterium]
MPLSVFTKISLIYLVRSIARTVSATGLIFLAMGVISAGKPDFRALPRGEIISTIMLGVIVAGLVLGWWRELVGAILILGGFFAFMASVYVTSGEAGISPIFLLFPLAGSLFLAFWLLTRKR